MTSVFSIQKSGVLHFSKNPHDSGLGSLFDASSLWFHPQRAHEMKHGEHREFWEVADPLSENDCYKATLVWRTSDEIFGMSP